MNKFKTKQFAHRDGLGYGEFSYFWSYWPYNVGDTKVSLSFNIDLEGYTDDAIANFDSYIDYPDLAGIIERIVLEEGGLVLPAKASFKFCFTDKKTMLNFIHKVNKTLRSKGIIPYEKIDRCSAFPSATYATNFFPFVFGESCSIAEIDEAMMDGANKGLFNKAWGDLCNFTDLPCDSKEKFDPMKNTDVTGFLDNWDKHIKDVIKKHSEYPDKLNLAITTYERDKRMGVTEVENISDRYNSFQGMWY